MLGSQGGPPGGSDFHAGAWALGGDPVKVGSRERGGCQAEWDTSGGKWGTWAFEKLNLVFLAGAVEAQPETS